MAEKTEPSPKPEELHPDGVTGRVIVSLRKMSRTELEAESWEKGRHGAPSVLVLSDGTRIYAARDSEGNGPGALFATDKHGKGFRV